MATATNQYQPDYAVPPGWIIGFKQALEQVRRLNGAPVIQALWTRG